MWIRNSWVFHFKFLSKNMPPSHLRILLHLSWNSYHPNPQKRLAGQQLVLQVSERQSACPCSAGHVSVHHGPSDFPTTGYIVSVPYSNPSCSNLSVLSFSLPSKSIIIYILLNFGSFYSVW